MNAEASPVVYRGRLAPSPTGLLHLGHARTFWTAQNRAQRQNGILVLRNEDLDHTRCRPAYVSAMIEDLRWFGFRWQEGPDIGGSFGPYSQSVRTELYRAALRVLLDNGSVYACTCSRRDILGALHAPHADEDEPIYPGTCRNKSVVISAGRANWRFRVPDGQTITFQDGNYGRQEFVAGRDFGDFVVWRQDDLPAYQLAVVVDDAAMRITEVVRGEDLLISTARQLLLYRALGVPPPAFYHCPLVNDKAGVRLSKRYDSLSLRAMREAGQKPEMLRAAWQ